MTEKGDARPSSLEAVRALERQLAERAAETSALDAALAPAQDQADRIRAQARVRGAEAASTRRRQVLEEVDREAARIRAEGDRRSTELRAAMAATLPETLAVLSPMVLPPTEESQCSSR